MRRGTVDQRSTRSLLEQGFHNSSQKLVSVDPSSNGEADYSPLNSTAPKKQVNETENPILFWKHQLDINVPFLGIPTDFPRSATTSDRIDHVSFSLSASCLDALKQLSKDSDATLFTIFLAAYNLLLFRYTRQEDIVIGFPTLKNIFNEKGKLINTLHNTEIFRTDLSGNPSFNELLKRVHDIVSEGNRHKDASYEALEDVMKLEFGAHYTGLYNIMFSFRNAGVGDNEIKDWIANISVPENARRTIDLALYAEETIQGLNGVWTYNSELFGEETIKRLAKHFGVLLEGIASNPQQSIAQLPLLTDKEIHQLTSEWNRSTVSYPADKCIHELFEARAIETPDAIALVFEKKELTYAELNKRANQLARYLINRGVKKETLVPLCIGRSLEMIIGILGILKAGGAYVPIDPNYPLERLSFLLYDTGARVVVCNEESKLKLKAFHNIDFVELSDKASFMEYQSADNLNIDISSNNLAYIIYTSGSTGKPKGVMIEHRALADHCYGVIESAGLTMCKSFALFSPLVFDAGHSIIHSCFILGASLHVLSEELILNAEKATTYLDDHAIDCIKIVPSLWLSYAGLQNIALSKKVIILGGEAFPLSILNYLRKASYAGAIYNHYGPTEVTIGKCIHKVDLNKSYRTVPIGKPFSNTQLYVLDDYLQLTPVGLEGELYVAGDGVARGYLNQPDLTTEKFISNPFNTDSPGRMYKTGDKVRWLFDGNIEYLGRADEQVKIQGHRIELGEIEEALLQSELVCQAVVLANSDKNGNKRLVEYIVPTKSYNKDALTAFLKKKLPEYMVPVKCIELETLPLTRNGKINKKALESLDETEKKYVAPGDDVETKLATIWQDLLKIDRVSIHDDFFDLGGNSIHAVSLFSKIKKIFHKDFPLVTIFSAPTIYQLAVAIKAPAKALSSFSSLIPIQPNGSKTPLFTVHAGHGDILFYQNLALSLGPDQPFYALQAKGINGIELPYYQMEEMADYYISEIRKVQPEGPYYFAGYCLGARIIFEMAQQLTRQGQKIALLANLNGISPTYRFVSNKPGAEMNGTPQMRLVKVSRHLNNMAKISLKDKVLYLFGKLKKRIIYRLRMPAFLLKFKICELIFKLYLLFKLKAPGSIARFYVGGSLHMLQSKYKPKEYPGSMVVLRSPGIYTDPYLGWRNFVKGEIKTYDIPGKHTGRRDIMNEPYVQFTAKELANFLEH
jgi:amino acid adenylation domain-containing protein